MNEEKASRAYIFPHIKKMFENPSYLAISKNAVLVCPLETWVENDLA